MKATDPFKQVIQTYLEERAATDSIFAEKFNNPEKKLDDCITYILNWVKAQDCNGFADEEIFSQAVHYYDEDNIEVGKPINCKVVVNHSVELTEEEKAEAKDKAKQLAMNEAIAAEKARLTRKQLVKKEVVAVPSLWD